MSSKKHKKYKLKIKWIGDPVDCVFPNEFDDGEECKQRTYDFRTKQERDIFMMGVEQAIGWSDFEILKDKEYDNE